MYIGQIARQQKMLYNFINRGGGSYISQMQSQLSSLGNFGASGKSAGTDASNLLQNMAASGLSGRTAREMAQYQMRVQGTQSAASAQQTYTQPGTAALSQGASIRQQYTPISDEATEAMQQLALEDAKNSINSSGMDSTQRANLIREQLQGVDPSKRTAAFNTMNKVWESEIDRIGEYIKKNDPSWTTWGDKFDTAILDDYKAGVNIWV